MKHLFYKQNGRWFLGKHQVRIYLFGIIAFTLLTYESILVVKVLIMLFKNTI